MTTTPIKEGRVDRDHDLTERLPRYAVAALCALALAVLAPGIAHSSSSRVIVHRTDVLVRGAQECERNLDRDRAPHATRRTYSASQSMPFRRWAYRLWRDRANRACAKARWLNDLPPRAIVYVFKRIGQDDVDQALHVASYEAGSQDIWLHPYCTRVDNGVGYLGCFQMGSWARSHYGHGKTALDQAWAAYRYRVDAGGWCSGWSATAWGC